MPAPLHGLEWEGWRLGDPSDPGDPGVHLLLRGRADQGGGVTGLLARRAEVAGAKRSGEGVSLGRMTFDGAEVAAESLIAPDRQTLLGFIGAMEPVESPSDERLLTMRGILWADEEDNPVDVGMWVRPNGAVPDVTTESVGLGIWMIRRALWVASDPTAWSADPTVVNRTASGGHSFTATNAGTRTVQASAMRGAWSLVLTASGGPVVSPWVQIAGRRVTWQGLTVPSGETLTVTRDRQSILSPADAPVNGRARTPGEAAPHWPVLPPGASTVTMGCASGSFAVAWQHWSSW